MSVFSNSVICLAAYAAFCGSQLAGAAVTSSLQHERKPTSAAFWNSSNAQHVYGLPDTKPNDRGTLRVDAQGLSFAGKSANFFVQWHSVITLSAGNEQVELWGGKGRILRMLIPFSGGLAVAAVTHHRVDELTVEFRDSKGGYHGAVFLLPDGEAQRALESSVRTTLSDPESDNSGCEGQPVQPGSVLLRMSLQPRSDVPSAYRALIYEHFVDRLSRVRGVRLVYREGQKTDEGICPQFNVQVAIASFHPGSQVMRASTGPIGMFAAPTELTVDVTFSDASTGERTHQRIKSTIRDDSESWRVTEKAARSLVKHFSSECSKELQKSDPGRSKETIVLSRHVDN